MFQIYGANMKSRPQDERAKRAEGEEPNSLARPADGFSCLRPISGTSAPLIQGRKVVFLVSINLLQLCRFLLLEQ